MASTSITKLTTKLKAMYKEFAKRMKKEKIPFKVTCTARSVDEQIALWSQGRNTLTVTNTLRRKVGMKPITSKENSRKITWTINSMHITTDEHPKARAFDIVITRGYKVDCDVKIQVGKKDIPIYEKAAEIGRSVGLKVGADFRRKDYPHYEEL